MMLSAGDVCNEKKRRENIMRKTIPQIPFAVKLDLHLQLLLTQK